MKGSNRPRFTSYINNLHPEYNKPLYSLIEDIIAAAIPLWSQTLTPLRAFNLGFYSRNARISYTAVEYDPDPENFPEDQKPQQGANEHEYDFWDR